MCAAVPQTWIQTATRRHRLCVTVSFLRQPLRPLECDTPWAGLDFVALSSSPPPYSAKTAVFCIFVFCFEANGLRILCQPLRRLEAPRGAVNQGWESPISHRKKAQEKQAYQHLPKQQRDPVRAAAQCRHGLHSISRSEQVKNTFAGLPAYGSAPCPLLAVPGQLTQRFSGPSIP